MPQARDAQYASLTEEARKFHKKIQCEWIFDQRNKTYRMFHCISVQVAGQIQQIKVPSMHPPQITNSQIIWSRHVTPLTISSAQQNCTLKTAYRTYMEECEAVYLQKSGGFPDASLSV
jgi:hypothetical protein